jgi:hypothetical protein
VVRKLQLVVGGLTILMAFLLVTAMGCDGDDGEVTPSPDSTSTPETSEVEDQLRQLVLQLEDLPSGVIVAEQFFVTAEESAAEVENREERLAKLQEWGYVLGHDVTYQANPQAQSAVGLILANSTASLYSSEEGASASFADAAETARTTDWADLFSSAQDVQVEEIDSPALTDEMLWLRITAKATPEGETAEQTFAQEVILFRQGPARGSLMVAWAMEDGNDAFIRQLAEAQAQNMKDALS